MKVRRKREQSIDSVELGCAQHIGNREDQQDSFRFSDIEDSQLLCETGVLSVMADGMGGLALGKQASQIAVDTVIDVFTNKSISELCTKALVRAVQTANEKVIDAARRSGVAGNAGTTLVAAVIHDSKLHYVSVGDSRIYLYQNGELLLLNTPHNYANELQKKVAAGQMTLEQAENDPEGSYLTSYLGMDMLNGIDYNAIPYDVNARDIVLICSDGLFNTLNDSEIKEILSGKADNVQIMADMLVNETVNRRYPCQDNVTVALMRGRVAIGEK
jgi:protein phosphatase